MFSLLITCVNYADYLDCSLSYNIEIFDTIYIVSQENDIETKKIVDKYSHKNITLLLTNSFYDETSSKQKPFFNKGKALDYGLSLIPKKDWILIGDADCIYPISLKTLIHSLDQNKLYTTYRKKVFNKQDVEMSVKKLWSDSEYIEILDSIRNDNHNQKLHMVKGYCQLFNFQNIHIKNIKVKYPEGKSCRHVDTIFSRTYFPRRSRSILDTYCIHLGETCVNWNGRRSQKF